MDSELNSVDGKTVAEANGKRQAVLDSFFSDKPAEVPKGRFADPAMFFGGHTATE